MQSLKLLKLLDHNSPLFECPYSVTFVRDYTVFWTMVNSSTIRSIDNQAPPNNTTSTTRPPAGSQQTLPVSIQRHASHFQIIRCLNVFLFCRTEFLPQKHTFECDATHCDSPCTNFHFNQPLISINNFYRKILWCFRLKVIKLDDKRLVFIEYSHAIIVENANTLNV